MKIEDYNKGQAIQAEVTSLTNKIELLEGIIIRLSVRAAENGLSTTCCLYTALSDIPTIEVDLATLLNIYSDELAKTKTLLRVATKEFEEL